MSRDAGSIPAASTQTGCTTRLERKKARQYQLAGLGRFVHVDRDLRDIDHTRGEQIAGLTLAQFGPKNLELAQESRIGPRVSKSRDAPQVSPAMEVR